MARKSQTVYVWFRVAAVVVVVGDGGDSGSDGGGGGDVRCLW